MVKEEVTVQSLFYVYFETFSHQKETKRERKTGKKRDRKTATLKISSKNCIKIIQQILTVFVYCCSGKIFKKLFSSIFLPLYRLPALPILPVNSIIFTILPIYLKPGKSSTLVWRNPIYMDRVQFERLLLKPSYSD